MIQQKDIDEINYKLNQCASVQEMFNVLSTKFDLTDCKPGIVAKPMFISGIVKGIKMLNPKIKK